MAANAVKNKITPAPKTPIKAVQNKKAVAPKTPSTMKKGGMMKKGC